MPAINVTPAVIAAAALQLEQLANTLQAALIAAAPPTFVIPSGAEEVSVQSAIHFNRAANTHHPAAEKGIHELRHAADVLKRHAGAYVASDLAHSALMRAIQL